MAQQRKYFFLNDQLHQKIQVNRGKDLMAAWNYPEGKLYKYTYTDALRRMEPAFTSRQVAQILHRDKTAVEKAIWRGHVPQPQFIYALEKRDTYRRYMWKEEEILGLLDYFASIHYGRPRNDGLVTPKYLPTPREVRAMIRDDKLLYGTKGYVPSWKAKEIRGK